jgi:hypothetical protein
MLPSNDGIARAIYRYESGRVNRVEEEIARQ